MKAGKETNSSSIHGHRSSTGRKSQKYIFASQSLVFLKRIMANWRYRNGSLNVFSHYWVDGREKLLKQELEQGKAESCNEALCIYFQSLNI